MNQKNILLKGLLSTLILSIIWVVIFFGPLLKNPNKVYFSKVNDGIQLYCGQMYHIKYDSSYMRCSNLNYPYGEMIYFTGTQLAPVSIIKLISNNILDISDYFVGIQNMLMLTSIIFAALLIFLIFFELGVGWFPGCIASIAIAFLSPQIDRFGGHYSLAYIFTIPLIIYLIILFQKKHSYVLSILICLVSFWAFTTHAYLFALNGVLLLFYWIHIFRIDRTKWKINLIYFFIQFILPYLLAQVLAINSDTVTDRTQKPWGFLLYRAYPEGIFLPFTEPYGKFLTFIFKDTSHLQWEGLAYIGIVGVFTFCIILIRWFKSILSKQFSNLLSPTDNNLLNVFFWGSFLALLYSFGLPYILRMGWLMDYIGPLKQMRGIGRFAWLFFYIINIIGIYIIWNYQKIKNIKYLIWIALFILCFESYYYTKGRAVKLNNSFPELDDKANKMPENEWVKLVNPKNFQAIIPLPYFHVGSENISIEPKCNNMAINNWISLKTGLPSTGIYLNRTSISQSYNNIQLTKEPYRKLVVLQSCKNKKPFLLLACKCNDYNSGESYLINQAKQLYAGSKFTLYELSFEKLEHISDSLYSNTFKEYLSKKLFKHGEIETTNDTLNFVYKDYDTLNIKLETYIGPGVFSCSTNLFQTIYDGQLPNCNPKNEYLISFWFGNILKDTYMRSTLITTLIDSTGHSYQEKWEGFFRNVKLLDNNWALCEKSIKLKSSKDKVKITLRTEEIRNGKFLVDELLIRPASCDIYKITSNGIIKNNRLYIKE